LLGGKKEERHTMLPGSLEARAKMKMTRGQLEELPFSRSLLVDESWRAASRASLSSSTGAAAGSAATTPAAARIWRNFMLLVGWGRRGLRQEIAGLG
jgi:hypothetical protein